MAKNGRPPASLDDWLDWQQRLASQKASGLSIEVYCLQEGVSRSTFYRWQRQLKNGVPAALLEDEADRQQAESEEVSEATFLPVSLQASPVEIELPNGGVVRLPLGVGQAALVAVVEAAGTLRPWKAPKS
jgi:transposase-like protein